MADMRLTNRDPRPSRVVRMARRVGRVVREKVIAAASTGVRDEVASGAIFSQDMQAVGRSHGD